MISKEEIKELEKIKDQEILSLYLNCDQRLYKPEEIKVNLENLLRKNKEIKQDIQEKIKNYVNFRLNPRIKGLVIFFGKNWWKVYSLPCAIKNQIFIDITPYTKLLNLVLDEYERFCVVVIDKEKARLFTVYLGEIEEYKQKLDRLLPGKHAQGGWSQLRYQRHHQAHVREHLVRVAKEIFRIFRRNNFDRLIIAGSKEILPEFERNLHNYLKSKLAGKFYTELFAPTQKILNKALKIEEQIERQREDQLVLKLENSLGKKGRGVAGLFEVLQAASEKDLQILLLNEDFKASGCFCSHCGYLSTTAENICPLCKEKLSLTDEITEKLIEKALEQGAKLEFIKNNQKLKKLGGIGAFLRYKLL